MLTNDVVNFEQPGTEQSKQDLALTYNKYPKTLHHKDNSKQVCLFRVTFCFIWQNYHTILFAEIAFNIQVNVWQAALQLVYELPCATETLHCDIFMQTSAKSHSQVLHATVI